MESSAMNGAQFGDLSNAEAFRSALVNDLKVVEIYSFGGALVHHATVIKCDDNSVYKIEIRGIGDQPQMFLRLESARWDPPRGEAVFQVTDVTLRAVYDHALRCCAKFGLYNAATNNCQNWNNAFLKIFKLKRRTWMSWLEPVAAAATFGSVIFVAILRAMIPNMMQITNGG